MKFSQSLLVVFFLSHIVQAQYLSQFASYFPVADKEAKPGDILSKNSEMLVRAQIPRDPNIFGVVAEKALITFHKPTPESLLVVTNGEALVKVSNAAGEIKEGDFITSSEIPGVGQKLTQSGMALGKALENFNEKEGMILVNVDIKYVSLPGNTGKPTIRDFFQLVIQGMEKPENFPVFLKYIFAIFLAIGSFFFGSFFSIRAMQKGVEAIGRNPLAKRHIQAAIVLNLIGLALLTLAGLGLSLFVILY